MIPAHELHNQLAGEIVKAIVQPIVDNGGSPGDLIVLLESVNAGVLMAMTVLLGGSTDNGVVIDTLAEGVRTRLAELIEQRRSEMN